MKKAVVVGNGSSILGSGLGERIDSFETVFRFRRAEEKLAECRKDTGTKIDILVSNFNPKLALRPLLEDLQSGHVEKYGIKSIVFTSAGRQYEDSVDFKNIWSHIQKNQIPTAIFRYCEGTVAVLKGLDIKTDDLKIPKTFTGGLNLVCCLLNNIYKFHPSWEDLQQYEFDKIYLCGFDWLTDKPSQTNFYNPTVTPYGYKHWSKKGWHNLENEAIIFNRLMEKTDILERLK